jgi:hypothetical protein
MNTTNVQANCRAAANSKRQEVKDWGFSVMADSEMEALQIAYFYRNSPNGLLVENCPNIGKFMVTVWNEHAKAMGCNV